jgi:hypothetical protein
MTALLRARRWASSSAALKYRMKGSRGLTATTSPLSCHTRVDERRDRPAAFGCVGFGVPELAAELGKGLFGLVEPWVERDAGSFVALRSPAAGGGIGSLLQRGKCRKIESVPPSRCLDPNGLL